MRRISVDPGAGTNTTTLIAHYSGVQPLLHSAGMSPSGNAFQFQLTSDAGKIYTIEKSSDLSLNQWSTLSSASNFYGTMWVTNPNFGVDSNLFFRAKLAP